MALFFQKKCFFGQYWTLPYISKLGPADPKAIQQINFTGNLKSAENTTIFFIFEEVKETVLNFLQGTVRVLWIYFAQHNIKND